MRLVVALLSVVALAFAAPAAADAPMEFPILDVFEDVNPCTGDPMTVTFVGTTFIDEHGSRVLGRAERTITTSDGFVGHGTDSFVHKRPNSGIQIDRHLDEPLRRPVQGASCVRPRPLDRDGAG